MPVSFQSAARCRRVSSHHRGIPAVTPIGCYSCLVPRRREGRPVFVWHCKLLPRARYLPVGDVVAGSPVFLCRLLPAAVTQHHPPRLHLSTLSHLPKEAEHMGLASDATRTTHGKSSGIN
jgi:hypothetical protein